MEPRLNIITLGVADLSASRFFYETGLGWKASPVSSENIVFFQLGSMALALYPFVDLAEDAVVAAEKIGNYRGFTMAQNVREKEDVDRVLHDASTAGGKITKAAQDVFWGGRSGYFADPDGNLWEVAWNPFFVLDDNGALKLPE